MEFKNRFAKYDHTNKYYIPDNRPKVFVKDNSDDIIVGATVTHTFKLPFLYSELVKDFTVSYRQGIKTILEKNENSLGIEIIEECGHTFVSVELSIEDTNLFGEHAYRTTQSQIKLNLKDGQVWFGPITKLNVFKTIKPLEKEVPEIKFCKDFLYETTFNYLDYAAANKYYANKKYIPLGGCSAIRAGNYYGRNYDWYYNNNPSIIVKTNVPGYYKTLGIASTTDPILTNDFIKNKNYSELYNLLPFMLLDGINEKGLVCNLNVVPIETEYGVTTETTAEIEQKQSICMMMLPRFILDNFANADEAIQYLKNYMSIWTSKGLVAAGYEIHLLLADPEKTYVLEFINNELQVIDLTNVNYQKGITNFYLYDTILNDDNTVYTPVDTEKDKEKKATEKNNILPHGAGLERFNIIQTFGNKCNTKEGMRELLNKLKYTNAYLETTDPQWYTEFTGGNLTVDSTPEEFEADIMIRARKAFKERSRDTAKTWQTTNSCVYDITARKLYLITQEDNQEIELTL